MPRKKLTKAEEEKRVAELIARLKAKGVDAVRVAQGERGPRLPTAEVVASPSDAKLTDAQFQEKFDRDVAAWNARHRAGEFDALPKPRPLFDEPPPPPNPRRLAELIAALPDPDAHSLPKPRPNRRRKTSYGQGTRMPRKKMTEAEKKVFAAKMAAARAAARAKKITDKAALKYYAAALTAARRRGEGDAYGVEFKSEAERAAWIANMQAARLKKLGVSAEALAAAPAAPAKKPKKKRKPKFLAETMAKLGPASSSPRQKKSRTKKARKSAKSQKKRAGATLAATLKALSPKSKAPKKRASKKSGKVCFPVGSAAAQAALAAKGRKKSASKKPKKAKKTKKAAPKQAIRKVGGFVFPHASGSERKCVKCGRLHSLREHWSHKYMHATARTKHSYLCKRGGFCAFENLSKRDLAQALKIESERSKSKKRQAELALKYYKLMGKIR